MFKLCLHNDEKLVCSLYNIHKQKFLTDCNLHFSTFFINFIYLFK